MAFLTTEPNSIVAPIHPKAMPVILSIWLNGSANETKALQRRLPDDALELVSFFANSQISSRV